MNTNDRKVLVMLVEAYRAAPITGLEFMNKLDEMSIALNVTDPQLLELEVKWEQHRSGRVP